MRRLSIICNYTAIALGVTSMALWEIFGGHFPPYGPRMRFNGGLAIAMIGCAKWALHEGKLVRLGRFLAILTVAFAAITLSQDLYGTDLGIDNFLLRDLTELGSMFHPGRMAPSSSLSFIMLSVALVFYEFKGVYSRIAQCLCLLAGAVSIAALFGYLFGASLLYQFSHYIKLSPYSATSIILLSFAIICANPEFGFIKLVRGANPSALFARQMLAATVLFPPTLGFLFMLVEDRQALPSPAAAALVAVITVFFFFLVIWHSADAMSSSEKALGDSELQFRTLANSIPQLSWIADAQGNLIWFNQRWHDYVGNHELEAKAWKWEDAAFQHPDHLARTRASWAEAVRGGQPWESTFPLKGKDNEYRWFLARAHPIHNSAGALIRWFGSNTDVDDRLRFEQELKDAKLKAERANEAKSLFLANMSHEIRSPLAAVIGFTNILRAENLGAADRSKFMGIIERNSTSLLRLIDDILDLSKVEADKIILESAVVDFEQFLEDLDAAMKLRAESKGIRFNLKKTTALPAYVNTDVLRLRQILTNLIGNAIKFTHSGSVELEVLAEPEALRFIVTDTGIGIAPENVQNLFKAFSQADASFSRRFGGSGLGLVLAKRLALLLGGDLELKSTEHHRGSTFEARIKKVAVKMDEPRSSEADPHPDKIRFEGKRILVVEDTEDNQILISSYLKATGAQISFANDGREGVEKCLRENPDIVLMDIQMPILDGNSAIKQLRALGFAKPILALSAHAMPEEKRKSFAAGCTDYLTKPVTQIRLLDALQRNQTIQPNCKNLSDKATERMERHLSPGPDARG